jgi:hypothetical protein
VNFNSPRVKYLKRVPYCNIILAVTDSDAPYVLIYRLANKSCLNLPAKYAGKSPEIAQQMPSEWRCHSRDSMRHVCGQLMGTKSSIHMQWPAKASIFLWVSHRSVAPENMGKSEPTPVEDTCSSATSSTIDIIWSGLKLNLGLHAKMQETT